MEQSCLWWFFPEWISPSEIAIQSMEATITSLQESLLDKDESLVKSENKIRGIFKLIANKSEKQPRHKQAATCVVLKPKADLKARKNNGAKRNMHYELKEVVKDMYPDDAQFDIQKAIKIGIRESVRYNRYK